MWIQSLPKFTAGNWTGLVGKLRTEYRAKDYHQRIETRDFIEAFVRISTEQPGNLRHYVHDFTTISARTVAAGNLTKQEKGWWFMRGLPIEFRRHAMEKTRAVADKPSTLIFKRLKEAVELRIVAIEGAKRMDILPEEDVLNIQLIQELRQQRPGVHGGALTQQQSSTTDQEVDEMVGQLKSLRLSKTEPAVAIRLIPFLNQIRMDLKELTTLSNQATDQGSAQGPAQGYSLAPGYKDWQNSTRPPQDFQYPYDFQYPQDSRPPQDSRYTQGSQYPQDSTTCRQPQQNARGQRGTQGQGPQTYFRCGGSYYFTEYECQGLKDLIQ